VSAVTSLNRTEQKRYTTEQQGMATTNSTKTQKQNKNTVQHGPD